MATIEDIFTFIEQSQNIHRSKIHPESDLCLDLRIEGDDFFEFEVEFAKEFKVDMSGYLWYFHHAEEVGAGIGGLFFKPPYSRVTHIPVTPLVLLEAANKGKWHIEYPAHYLPPKRYEIYVNRGIAVILLAVGFYILYRHFA